MNNQPSVTVRNRLQAVHQPLAKRRVEPLMRRMMRFALTAHAVTGNRLTARFQLFRLSTFNRSSTVK
jgi:hypothetical protein